MHGLSLVPRLSPPGNEASMASLSALITYLGISVSLASI